MRTVPHSVVAAVAATTLGVGISEGQRRDGAEASLRRPLLFAVAVGNGGHPFAGDRRLLATVTPNGDGLRDRAVIRFGLTRAARVSLTVRRTRSRARPAVVIWHRSLRLRRGHHRLAWKPPAWLPARTYLIRLAAVDAAGTRSVVGRLHWRDPFVPAGPVV